MRRSSPARAGALNARYRSRHEYGRARHVGPLAQWVPLHPVPGCAQRHPASLGTSPGAEAATPRGTASATRRYLCGPAVPAVLRDLGLSSNRVFGLTRTDEEWSTALDAALTSARRDDLEHGTNAAYIHGCVCKDCRTYQLVRMGRNRN